MKLSKAAVAAASGDLIAATATSPPAGADLRGLVHALGDGLLEGAHALFGEAREFGLRFGGDFVEAARVAHHVLEGVLGDARRAARAAPARPSPATGARVERGLGERALGVLELHGDGALGAVHGDAGDAGGGLDRGAADVGNRVGEVAIGDPSSGRGYGVRRRMMVRRNNFILGRRKRRCQGNFGAMHQSVSPQCSKMSKCNKMKTCASHLQPAPRVPRTMPDWCSATIRTGNPAMAAPAHHQEVPQPPPLRHRDLRRTSRSPR